MGITVNKGQSYLKIQTGFSNVRHHVTRFRQWHTRYAYFVVM
jgi:hypothetical protein